MILDSVENLTKGAHKKVRVQCDYKISEKCRNIFISVYKDVIRYRKSNSDTDICLFCSRRLKYSGRKNPNCKYIFDDNFLEKIDTEEKAYLLGWIASDGTIRESGVKIAIHSRDEEVLIKLRSLLGTNIPITHQIRYNPNTFMMLSALDVSSRKIALDCAKHLKIGYGKKSYTVGFPNLPIDLIRHFIRGFFDGDGGISIRKRGNGLQIGITTNSGKMREGILTFITVPFWTDNKEKIEWYGTKALSVLQYLYDASNIYLERKYALYLSAKLLYTKRGVYFRNGKWTAKMNINKKLVWLGTFSDKEEAYQAYYNSYLNHYKVPPW